MGFEREVEAKCTNGQKIFKILSHTINNADFSFIPIAQLLNLCFFPPPKFSINILYLI